MSVIEKTGITLQVTKAIRQAIITGEYKPGQKLSEYTLSERYEISRTPVREALKHLNLEGLVEIVPRVGTYVSKPSYETLNELFTIKEVLEGLAARLLAENRDENIINQLEESCEDMKLAYKETDYKVFSEANDKFHQLIHLGSKNDQLSSFLKILINQVSYNRYVYLSIKRPGRFKDSLEEHKEVLEAIKKGNGERAETLMRKHVKTSEKMLKAELHKLKK